MTPDRVRRTLAVLAVVSFVLPAVFTVLGVCPPSTMLLALLLAFGFSRGYALLGEEKLREQRYGEIETRPNSSHTIYVQMVDERGALLPKEEQERRLAEAYRNATPRDVVVPVTERVSRAR